MFGCILITFVIVTNTNAQGFLKAGGQKIVNEKGENVLLRGIGLGGWMLQEGYMLGFKNGGQQHVIRQRFGSLINKAQLDEFYDVWLSNHTTKADIDSLKSWGFNSVRLPMHYNLYTLAADEEPIAGNNTWLTRGFALTDSLLSWCKANKMYLILDLHAAPGGQGNDLNISDRDPAKPSLWESEASQKKTIALWKQLATRYVNEPWIGAYDIINEPNFGFDDPANDKNGTSEKNNKPLKQLLIDITKAIRTIDNNHIIVIEGNGWGNNYNGILDQGLWDKNLVLSFHKYWNFNDEASIKHILDYREKYNIPVWLGETGENSNVWFTQAISLFEKNNIGWAWWPLKKLGVNNPLQIKSNPNYDAVIAYLNGDAKERPGQSVAYSGLLEMALYTNIKTNMVHRDVVDAMFRQPHDKTAKPFKQHNISSGAIINAVDYDLGPNGVAYLDNDTADYWTAGKRGIGNRGGVYRNDGVDIFRDSSYYDSYYVGSIEAGEWLQYTVHANASGVYTLQLTYSASGTTGVVDIANNGKSVAAASLVDSAGKNSWQVVEIKKLLLQKGKNTLRLYFKTGGFNFKQLKFIP